MYGFLQFTYFFTLNVNVNKLWGLLEEKWDNHYYCFVHEVATMRNEICSFGKCVKMISHFIDNVSHKSWK